MSQGGNKGNGCRKQQPSGAGAPGLRSGLPGRGRGEPLLPLLGLPARRSKPGELCSLRLLSGVRPLGLPASQELRLRAPRGTPHIAHALWRSRDRRRRV